MCRVRTCIAVASWLLLLSAPALAQTTAGSIAGVVKDTTGAVLPGVTVEASSPALIEKVRSAVTDGAGLYRIVDLRPGTYTVTFTLPGFSVVKRDGIELTTGFTAAVNADLRVGTVEETISVTGESPIVDIQNTQQGVVMTREVIDAIPTARHYTALGVLIPGVSLSSSRNAGNSGQEVGGTTGISSFLATGMTIHGGRINDQSTQVDGMPILTWSSIYQVFNMLSEGNFQEMAIDVASNSAEIESGGVRVNMIPREGGNTFSGRFFATGSHPDLQSNNLDDDLRAKGLRDQNRLKTLWQYNPAIGGPVVRNKLWFFTQFTQQRNENYLAGVYENTDIAAWSYVPNLNQQVAEEQYGWDSGTRLTWQATPRHKVTMFYDYNRICHCTFNVVGTTKNSGESFYEYRRNSPLLQVGWSAPMTNRLLFEAGASRLRTPTDVGPKPFVVAPQIIDTGLGISFRNGGRNRHQHVDHQSQSARGSVSYITGTHALKVGTRILTGDNISVQKNSPFGNVSYRVLNGVPTQVIYDGAETTDIPYVQPSIGVYGQDQWTLRRMTMNLGIRYDYFRSGYPDQSVDPTQFVPAARFVPGKVATAWHDLSPRLGLAYDLFGDAKTALKVSVGRYVLSEGTARAAAINPITANATNPRRWTDTNNDRVVQGDPLNPVANDELGPSTNLAFGNTASSLQFDPDWAFGFGKRPNSWDFSVGIQRALLPQVSVNVAYVRRVYGNFDATVNQAVTPADYTPYCVTTPNDARLPGGGGQQICGLYDVNANRVGQLQLVTTSASNFGDMSEHWNGLDFTVQARLRNAMLQGGLSTGKTTADTCDITQDHPEVVVAAPREAYWLTTGDPSATRIVQATATTVTPTAFCHVETPWSAQTQIKLLGSYTLPWDIQVAGTFQQLPGPPILASATYTSAQVTPSLGRGLSSASTVAVYIVPPGTVFGDRLNQFDLRLSKSIRVQGVRMQGMFDLYNLFNGNVVTFPESNYGATTGAATGSSWLNPRAILNARLIKFGVQLEF